AASVADKGTPPAQKKSPASETKQKSDKPGQTSTVSTSTEHIVKGGDTLSHLALQYYGNARKWPKIYEANKGTMTNPNYLYIGQKVIVPADTQRPA
ncbi:MAG TPA: LysM peptidoglycan-binding domain-containing protein, partial [Candidatus Binatia bacterium]|nr:LysM peptidoglycan-binding domain-containing protein [Candidatus Binatia bacterium]